MKTIRRISEMFLALAACFAMLPADPSLAFDSGSTGADGALEVTQNTELQLPPEGVFNFTTVHIAPGAVLTFTRNENNTPVTILASGDVLIEGAINLGAIGQEGGPGGYDGGVGGPPTRTGRRGEGPGGGEGGEPDPDKDYWAGCGGGAGFYSSGSTGGAYSYPSRGGTGGSAYGNARNVPLIGGSGGGGGGGTVLYKGGHGGGGGGALLLASSGKITISGSVNANGANGSNGEHYGSYYSSGGGGGGGGSGGAIRIVADAILGSGSVNARHGSGGSTYRETKGGDGSPGRILLEANTISQFIGTTPQAVFGPPVAIDPGNVPSLAIVSVGGVAVPSSAKGSFESPDIWLPYNTTNPVTVVVQATNIPAGSTITVKSQPVEGSVASASASLTGSTASIQTNLSTAFPSVVTAFATYELTASNGGPLFANGELIAKVRVETTLGGGSKVTYITESGREVSAVM